MAMRDRPVQRCLIDHLRDCIRNRRNGQKPISLRYGKAKSNTTRSKSYNQKDFSLDCTALNKILAIDTTARKIRVQPRVTMEKLIAKTLPLGLMPPVIPEFKGITVGGAIMGGAAESASHRYGIFFDTCVSAEVIDGRGDLIKISPGTNHDLFYGISGSYGAFGFLVSAEMNLIPASPSVDLRYHCFDDAIEALSFLKKNRGKADFLDGILFSREHAVIIEGNYSRHIPNFRLTRWYFDHVRRKKNLEEEVMPLYDYLFRYDQGAFWMGGLLFKPNFLLQYLRQGIFKIHSPLSHFNPKEIELFKKISFPSPFIASLSKPFMTSQNLWGLLHKAEKWIQDRLIIQDLCIPLSETENFLLSILEDPGTFPIWLCPIRGTQTTQYFAPHIGHSDFMNFGIYGVPSYAAPMSTIISRLEKMTFQAQGRKVLYSRSFYSEEEFWQIYPKHSYEYLRKKTYAQGVWRNLTEKVLSI
jgi:Delta24-sterol reductase